MRKAVAAVVGQSVAFLLLAACASAAPGPVTARGDLAFMQGMIAHHQQAIVMCALIPTRTARENIKLLGERITISQVDEIKRMARWLEARGQKADTTSQHHHAMPGMATAEELERLKQLSGTAFDRLFLELMIRHHEGALTMVRALFEKGDNLDPELFQLANDIDTDQRAEIARMQRLLSTLQ